MDKRKVYIIAWVYRSPENSFYDISYIEKNGYTSFSAAYEELENKLVQDGSIDAFLEYSYRIGEDKGDIIYRVPLKEEITEYFKILEIELNEEDKK